MWLDDTRGHVADWTTQTWVRLTGRRVALAEQPWLDGPAGRPAGIGVSFFEAYALDHPVHLRRGEPSGLLPDLEGLRSPAFEPSRVAPAVAAFYTRTSAYDLDAWSQWTGAFRPFGWLLARIFSRRLQQLNVPLSNLDTSRGMTSEVIAVRDAGTGQHRFSAWVRTLISTGDVVYSGAYGMCIVPDGPTPCVRVVFPLPNGNAIVLMRPTVHDDGSLTLTSAGQGFGSPGFYFTVQDGSGVIRARYLRSLRETIHVYPAEREVRADHTLMLWGATFLRIHYRLKATDADAAPLLLRHAPAGRGSAGDVRPAADRQPG
jgi:hypothetical protein